MPPSLILRAAPILLLMVLLGLWSLACTVLAIPDFLLPSPMAVWHAGIEAYDPIMMHAFQTLLTTLSGFALAVIIGVLLGVAVGISPLFYRACYPLMVGFNSIPKVAFVPVLVVWFGIGTMPAIITAFLISFFPIVVNVATGLSTLEPELEDVLRSLGASRFDILKKVAIPRALPYFFASLKVSITLAFVGSVIAETVASNLGIGYLMMSASSTMNMALVFAGLAVIGAMGIVMYAFFSQAEQHFTAWAHRGTHAP
ncbi:ABC transporter permease [Craterilacuibacter sp.]|uniref:ABC transporter permease n=1 Tax=Craterilacuibacter sp. TaxID=2870909 RepID=UPI003F337E91